MPRRSYLSALQYSLIHVDDKQAEEIFETLRLWGINSFRDFVTLPVAGVSERLGQNGVRLQQLACGKTERHLKLKQPAREFQAALELEHMRSRSSGHSHLSHVC